MNFIFYLNISIILLKLFIKQYDSNDNSDENYKLNVILFASISSGLVIIIIIIIYLQKSAKKKDLTLNEQQFLSIIEQ